MLISRNTLFCNTDLFLYLFEIPFGYIQSGFYTRSTLQPGQRQRVTRSASASVNPSGLIIHSWLPSVSVTRQTLLVTAKRAHPAKLADKQFQLVARVDPDLHSFLLDHQKLTPSIIFYADRYRRLTKHRLTCRGYDCRFLS
jgi:hypothetical protein